MVKQIEVVNLETKAEENPPTEIKVEFDEFAQMQNEVRQHENNEIEKPFEVEQLPEEEFLHSRSSRVEPIGEQPKPKAKRTTKRTIKTEVKVEDTVPEIKEVIPTTPVEEVKPAVEEVKPQTEKKIKTVELVSCPDCQKEMTKTTFRYSHAKNCAGKPIVREELPVKRRAPVKVKSQEVNEITSPVSKTYISIPEEILQQEINKRVKEQKEARIKARLKKSKS